MVPCSICIWLTQQSHINVSLIVWVLIILFPMDHCWTMTKLARYPKLRPKTWEKDATNLFELCIFHMWLNHVHSFRFSVNSEVRLVVMVFPLDPFKVDFLKLFECWIEDDDSQNSSPKHPDGHQKRLIFWYSIIQGIHIEQSSLPKNWPLQNLRKCL